MGYAPQRRSVALLRPEAGRELTNRSPTNGAQQARL